MIGYGIVNDLGGAMVTGPVPALTVWNPWAHELVHSGKIIENRSWTTRHRGWVLIHAAARHHPQHRQLPHGAILGAARLVDVHDTYPDLPGAERRTTGYWWEFRYPIAFEQPVPTPGRQGLWHWQNAGPEVAFRLGAAVQGAHPVIPPDAPAPTPWTGAQR